METLRKGSLLSMLCLALAGCSGKGERPQADAQAGPTKVHGLTPEQARQTLVKVGDTTITVGEFAERLAEQSPYLRARYNSPERRREFLDSMIRFELLAAEARRAGYDRLPEVQRARKQIMIEQLMKKEFEERVRLSDVTDDEVRAYYEAHPEEFNKPEQVRASHILVRDRAKAQRVLQTILAAADDANIFRQQAQEHTEDAATRDIFGDLRFFSRDGTGGEGTAIPTAIAQAAFGIERVGGVHPQLVQTEAGFHIVKLTAKRAALQRSLDEARRPIQNRLWREKRDKAVDDFIAGLRAQAQITENWGALDQLHLDIPEGGAIPELPEPPGGLAPGHGGGDDHAGHGHP